MIFKKTFFRIGMWNSRPPPPFHGKTILKFPFWLFETAPNCTWERKRRSVAKAVHCPSPINDRNSDSLDWKLAISLKKHEGNPFLVEWHRSKKNPPIKCLLDIVNNGGSQILKALGIRIMPDPWPEYCCKEENVRRANIATDINL